MTPERAMRDSRCPLCEAMILGHYGKGKVPSAAEFGYALRDGKDPDVLWPQMHPDDTLDMIVKLDGAWVHESCAREAASS